MRKRNTVAIDNRQAAIGEEPADFVLEFAALFFRKIKEALELLQRRGTVIGFAKRGEKLLSELFWIHAGVVWGRERMPGRREAIRCSHKKPRAFARGVGDWKTGRKRIVRSECWRQS